MRGHQTQVVTLTCHVILNALPNQWAAVQGLRGLDFVGGHPNGPNDASIKFSFGVKCPNVAGVRETQVSDVFFLAAGARALESRQVDADQSGGGELISGFFERFTRAARLWALAGVQMPGWVV